MAFLGFVKPLEVRTATEQEMNDVIDSINAYAKETCIPPMCPDHKEIMNDTLNNLVHGKTARSKKPPISEKQKQAFLESNPECKEFEVNGVKIYVYFPKDLFPQKVFQEALYEFEAAEEKIQRVFAHYSIKPEEDVRVVVLNDDTVNAQGAKIDILMSTRHTQEFLKFFETYLHERIHTMLTQQKLKSHCPSLIEGVANYASVSMIQDLGYYDLEDSGKHLIVNTADLLKFHKTVLSLLLSEHSYLSALEELLNMHFDEEDENMSYTIYYKLGQSLTEAFIYSYNTKEEGFDYLFVLYKKLCENNNAFFNRIKSSDSPFYQQQAVREALKKIAYI